METRKPYTLKKLILVHNVIQVVSCIYVIKQVGFSSLHKYQHLMTRFVGPLSHAQRDFILLEMHRFWKHSGARARLLLFGLLHFLAEDVRASGDSYLCAAQKTEPGDQVAYLSPLLYAYVGVLADQLKYEW